MKQYMPIPDKSKLDEVIEVLASGFEMTWTPFESKIENGIKINTMPHPNYPKEFQGLMTLINHSILNIENKDDKYQKYLWEYETWDIENLDLHKTALYIQYIFAMERFGEGFIAQHIENGNLLQLLKHLKQEWENLLTQKLSYLPKN